jgi:hypothetical protein
MPVDMADITKTQGLISLKDSGRLAGPIKAPAGSKEIGKAEVIGRGECVGESRMDCHVTNATNLH